MSEQLNTILERFKSKLNYREIDRTALDISRAAAAGNLGDRNYSEWALITDDPLVIVNYTKTFITTLASKLASAPFRPDDDALNELCLSIKLNSIFTEQYKCVLEDGYSFLGIGYDGKKPVVTPIDARYIMYNGNEPTLKDSTEMIVFEILPRSSDEDFISDFPAGYIEYDNSSEKIRTSHYHFVDGHVQLDIYEEGNDEVQTYTIDGVDRIPIVRFYGEKFELEDKRYHYRGLYYQMAGIIKATALAATKIQTRVAASDDANYIVSSDAIANNKHSWQNAGVHTIDNFDANGDPIKDPVIPVQHDNQFLIQALETWKNTTSDMLGPVVQSGSEAVTREEVIARSEVRDAIANTYLTNIACSIGEVYRIIKSMTTGDTSNVMVQGGFLEAQQNTQMVSEITGIYNLAKDSGLNAQGFVLEIVANCNLPYNVKQRAGQLLMTDPYASPMVKQLQGQLQQAQQTIGNMQQQMAILRTQASQRLERQAEWVAAQERIKRGEIQFKQWQQENKDTQEARMEVLRKLLEAGDTIGALSMLNTIQQIDRPVLADPMSQALMDQHTGETITGIMEGTNVATNNYGSNRSPFQEGPAAGTAGSTGIPAARPATSIPNPSQPVPGPSQRPAGPQLG